MSQLLAQRLRDAGVNVDLQMGDWTSVFQRLTTRGKGGWNVTASYSLGGTAFNPLTNSVLDIVMRSELQQPDGLSLRSRG